MKPTIQSPITGNAMVLCSEPRTLTFHDKEVRIVFWFYRDTDGEQYTETHTDEANLKQIYLQLDA